MTDHLRSLVRDVKDFPKPGIVYKDITPMLQHTEGLKEVTARFAERYADMGIAKVLGIESRGFLFGAPLAMALGAGMVPIRKQGKLPWTTHRQEYALEYGTDVIEMHTDAITPGERVLVIDDLLATGGTMAAALDLVRRAGGEIVEAAFVIELDFLKGREKLTTPSFSLLHY